MFLGDLMEQLNSLSKGIEKLEKKYEFFIEEERENLYTEEQFVYSEIEGILESLLEVKETVDYLNKNIFVEGKLESRHGKFYVNDYQLKAGDCLEFIIDKEWMKADISLVKGEYYIDLLDYKLKDVLFARVRV